MPILWNDLIGDIISSKPGKELKDYREAKNRALENLNAMDHKEQDIFLKAMEIYRSCMNMNGDFDEDYPCLEPIASRLTSTPDQDVAESGTIYVHIVCLLQWCVKIGNQIIFIGPDSREADGNVMPPLFWCRDWGQNWFLFAGSRVWDVNMRPGLVKAFRIPSLQSHMTADAGEVGEDDAVPPAKRHKGDVIIIDD